MILKKKLAISALSGILCLSCVFLSAGGGGLLKLSAAYADDGQVTPVSVVSSTSAESTASSAIGVPTPVIETYNTAVVIAWAVGQGGTEVAVSTRDIYYNHTGLRTYREYVFTEVHGADCLDCSPQYWYGKSYNSATDTYSDATTILRYVQNEDESMSYTASRQCLYPVVNGTKSVSSGTVPTSYDQTDYIWNHGGGSRNFIKGTLLFDDYICNMELDIPWIGYRTTEVTVNGVTISLRTGPNRCSIKVNQSDISWNRLTFTFGIS